MDSMTTLVTIIGSLITLGLAINGFFIRSLMSLIYDLRDLVSKLNERSDNRSKEIDMLQSKDASLETEINSLRNRHHDSTNTLGGRIAILEMKVDDYILKNRKD